MLQTDPHETVLSIRHISTLQCISFLLLEKLGQGKIFGQYMLEQPCFELGKHELIAALENLAAEVGHFGQQVFVRRVVIGQPGITIPLHECVFSCKMLGSSCRATKNSFGISPVSLLFAILFIKQIINSMEKPLIQLVVMR